MQDPSQANWQQNDQGQKVTLDITFSPDGTATIQSGSFREDCPTEGDLNKTLSGISEHGYEKVQQ